MRASTKRIILGHYPPIRGWLSAAAARGGAISSSTEKRVADAYRALTNLGLLPSVLFWLPRVGDNLPAAFTAVITPSGVSRALNAYNYTAGAYSEGGPSGGVLGDGSSTYSDSGCNPNTLGWSTSSLMLWGYHRTAAPGTGTTRNTLGNYTSTSSNLTFLGWGNGGTEEALTIGGTGITQYSGRVSPSKTGLIGGGTNGDRNNVMYINGTAQATVNAGSSGLANNNIFLDAINANGTAAGFSNRRMGSILITTGLSAASAAALNAWLQTFEASFGRKV